MLNAHGKTAKAKDKSPPLAGSQLVRRRLSQLIPANNNPNKKYHQKMDERRIAQTAGIALKIAKKFAGRSTWSQKSKGPGIYAPLKRWSKKGHSKLTTAFMHKVQHAKEHREEAERRQQSRGHASRTPTEERQRASKAPQKAP